MDEFAAVLKAREFVRKVGPTTIPVSVEAYLAQAPAILRPQSDLGPDEPGWGFSNKGKHYICVNSNDCPARQRFTICHELAHIVLGLPSEHNKLLWWSYAKRPPAEVLCDVFAAELLLPYGTFKTAADDVPMNLASVEDLASRFAASLAATGSRFAAVVGAPCAFVLSEKGKVRYASRSAALQDGRAWIQPRIDLPRGSVSARAHGGEACVGPEKIDADVWLHEWERGGVLVEEVRHLPEWNQTLTLLTFEDDEVPPQKRELREDEEELGLEELDGNLRWPSKNRRR